MANHNIRCITYVDEYSANNCSLRDLEIGVEHGVVGCGSSVFGSQRTKPGDFVVINAKKNNIKYAVIGILETKLETCDKWANEGGRKWPHNWTYIPLTCIFERTKQLNTELQDFCEIHGIKKNNLFHPRFSTPRNKPAIDLLIAKFAR